MRKPIVIIGKFLLSLIFVFVSLLIAMITAIEVYEHFCGSQMDAPGGGAAVGMFVVFFIGLPTLIFSVLTEIAFAFRKNTVASLILRLLVLLLPTIAGGLYTGWFSNDMCKDHRVSITVPRSYDAQPGIPPDRLQRASPAFAGG